MIKRRILGCASADRHSINLEAEVRRDTHLSMRAGLLVELMNDCAACYRHDLILSVEID
jgi:hypothetical protein